ncbi:hypothetical protein QN277_003628 [Acacia crassicarpa]|uniref:AP2/ERF domain-containing protein n=1 Tax=Acacia crassicarpa TaxID=499986 RepID=A0AAE1MCX2_9FABA|nr:hypothetical protein QN277_003628 [Acacia crassicarpa]
MASSSCSKRHPLYRGIRCRGEKWVSEIREPRKPSRIWLGTFPTPEMAAAAYDVAALALKGKDADLNLPEFAGRYPVPLSTSAPHIRSAATAAASLVNVEAISTTSATHKHINASSSSASSSFVDECYNNNDRAISISSTWSGTEDHQFVDEDAIFGMPSLLLEMAEGMLLSPPRITPPAPSDNFPAECLWNYF